MPKFEPLRLIRRPARGPRRVLSMGLGPVPGLVLALVLAPVLALVLSPAAARAETLTDALISAYRHSGLLEQNRAVLRATDEGVAVAVAALRPTINYVLSASKTYNSTLPSLPLQYSAGITSQLVLYDFGRGKKGVELAQENVMLTRESLRGIEQQVLLGAVQAYLNVRSAAQAAELQANNKRLIAQELRATRDRFEVGEATRTDVSQAEAALAAARAAEAAASGQLLVAREAYKAAVGHYPGRLEGVPVPKVGATTLDQATAVALAHNPNMKSAERAVKVAELNVELARLAMAPTLSATDTLAWQKGGNVSNTLGVTLGGTLYAGGKLSALLRKAEAGRAQARAGLHIARITVEQNVANAWSQLSVAAASRKASEERVRASRLALRGTRAEQSLGAKTTLDVLNAEQNLLDAQDAVITAQSNQYLGVYSLLAAMGLLTVDHLKLGIPTYDPEAYYNAVKDAPTTLVSPQGKKLDQAIEALLKD